MFLFTTPAARPAEPSHPVVDAIRNGAARTGVQFDYLLRTAKRESALDPEARSRSSSATGLFQFIEQTWLGLMKSEGASLGLGPQADAITARADGTFKVDDPAMRRAILDLRKDPATAATMAGILTRKNRDYLASQLQREPSSGDLYAAHFLGAQGAVDLARTAERSPRGSAAAVFPEAAAANRPIFFDRSGSARGAADVYAMLRAGHAESAQPVVAAAAGGRPDSPAASPFRTLDQGFHGLFQTAGRGGPVSEGVAKAWKHNVAAGTRVAALSYFPRSAGEEPSPVASGGAPVTALPADAAPSPPAAPAATEPRKRLAAPLDLGSFMKWRKR